MLRHLKDVHLYSQKKLNKLKPKLVEKINEVAIKEREKAVEKSRAMSTSTQNTPVFPTKVNRSVSITFRYHFK